MSVNWSEAEFASGLSCYRREEFFDAHEHWENAWRQLEDPERSFLQGLIQMTVAFHHLNSGNSAGAVSLLQRAFVRFDRCPARFGGVDVAALRNDVRQWLGAIEGDDSPRPVSYPEITLIEQYGNS